jgi:hypothetical protein
MWRVVRRAVRLSLVGLISALALLNGGIESAAASEKSDPDDSLPIVVSTGRGYADIVGSGYAVSVRAQDPSTGAVVDVPGRTKTRRGEPCSETSDE